MMSDAEALLEKTLLRGSFGFRQIQLLSEAVSHGRTPAVQSNADHSKLLEFLRTRQSETTYLGSKETIVKLTEIGIDAVLESASLVVIHAILDGAVMDLCRISALCAPDEWESELSNKQIALSDFRNATYQQLRDRKLSEYLLSLDRQSLLNKIDRLLAKCQPAAAPDCPYRYDKHRMLQLDQLRHEIVHGDGLMAMKPVSASDLEYLRDTFMWLAVQVRRKFQLNVEIRGLRGVERVISLP